MSRCNQGKVQLAECKDGSNNDDSSSSSSSSCNSSSSSSVKHSCK